MEHEKVMMIIGVYMILLLVISCIFFIFLIFMLINLLEIAITGRCGKLFFKWFVKAGNKKLNKSGKDICISDSDSLALKPEEELNNINPREPNKNMDKALYTFNGKDITMNVFIQIKDVVGIIKVKYDIDFVEALSLFYGSKTYRVLQNTENCLWAESAQYIADRFFEEKEQNDDYNKE